MGHEIKVHYSKMSSLKGGDIFNMASKGQKFKKYSKELRETVLKEYHEGYSAKYLADKYNIASRYTIFTWDVQTKRPMTGKPGRPKKEDIDYKERYEIIKKYQAFLKAQQERK